MAGALDTVQRYLLEDGHFLVRGQDQDMTRWTHHGMFRYLGADRAHFVGKESYSGNTLGFVHGSAAHEHMLRPLVHCALVTECITPEGSSLANHRQDQSALSVLAYSAEAAGNVTVTAHTELLAVSRNQLKPCREPSNMVLWTSRAGESCYASDAECA